jgi:amino acid adenylation domain-containing protein
VYQNKSAIEFGERIITYRELDQQSSRLALALQNDLQIDKKALGILLPRSPEMVITMLAILKAGCHFVPLDPTHPKDRLINIAKDGDLKAVITLTSTRHLVECKSIAIIDFETWDASAIHSGEPLELVSSSDLAYLIYTSGTTGHPKGVAITHLNLANLLQSIRSRINFKQDQRLLALTTFAFDIATLELLLPLTCGATLVLTDDQKLKNSEYLVDLIIEQEIDVVQATPAAWRMIMSCWPDEDSKRDNQERAFLCGGETLPVSLADKLLKTGSTVWNVYGPTETTIWSGALKIDRNWDSVPIGGPLDNTSFHILDSRLRQVPPGVRGELCIGGIGLSPGYHKRADLTRERFIQLDETDSNPIRVYRTGDSVRQTPDGFMEFIGRIDSQIKLRGHRIEMGEIETALESHAEVEEAVAVLNAFGEYDQNIQVFYRSSGVSEEPEENINTDLRRYLSEKLPAYMLPAGFCKLDRFPVTPNGKTDRKSLSKRKIAQSSSGAPPQTQLELNLAKVWKNLLKTDSVGVHDNFFEMGGHSLLILTAQNEIREKMGIKLPIIDFFQHPTLHALANHINNQTSNYRDIDRNSALTAGRSRLVRRRQNQKADQYKNE